MTPGNRAVLAISRALALRADVTDYLRTERHMTVDRLRTGLHALA